MRGLKINKTHIEILRLVHDHLTQHQIAETLHTTQPAMFYRIKALQKYGYLNKVDKGTFVELSLTEKGLRVVSDNLTKDLTASTLQTHQYRLHRCEASCTLLTSLPPDMPIYLISSRKIDYEPLGLKNHNSVSFIYKEIRAELTPTHLIVKCPQLTLPFNENPEKLKAMAMDALTPMFLEVEKGLGIKLKRLAKDVLALGIVRLEIAMTDNEVAKEVQKREDRLVLRDKKDGKRRVIIDASPPHGADLEAVHRQHAFYDIEKLGKFTEAVYTGKFDYEKDQEMLHELVQNQAIFARDNREHAAAIRELKELARNLNRKLSQRGIRDWL